MERQTQSNKLCNTELYIQSVPKACLCKQQAACNERHPSQEKKSLGVTSAEWRAVGGP